MYVVFGRCVDYAYDEDSQLILTRSTSGNLKGGTSLLG